MKAIIQESIKYQTSLTAYRGRWIVFTDARDKTSDARFTAYLADESVEWEPPVSGKWPGHARRRG